MWQGKTILSSSTLMEAGVVLRYCATQPMTFEMPDSVYAKYTLVGASINNYAPKILFGFSIII